MRVSARGTEPAVSILSQVPTRLIRPTPSVLPTSSGPYIHVHLGHRENLDSTLLVFVEPLHELRPLLRPLLTLGIGKDLVKWRIERREEYDERKISPGIWQNGCYCDGCLLVSFDLNNLLISSSDINSTYTVRVTSVRIAQNLTTVSNLKTRRIRRRLVTGLRNWNERGSHVRAFCESFGQEGLGRRGAARKYVQKPHSSNRFYRTRFPALSFVVGESCRGTINPEIYEFDRYMTIMTLQRESGLDS